MADWDSEQVRVWCSQGQIPRLKEMLSHHPVDRLTNYGYTGLHWAAAWKQTEAVKLFLEHGADPNAKNEFMRTPLHMVAHNGEKDCIQLLLAAGADVNLVDSDGKTPIEDSQNKEIKEILQGWGAGLGIKPAKRSD